MVQHHNPVRVKDGINAVCDSEDSPILEDVAAKSLLKECVRLNVDCSLRLKWLVVGSVTGVR
jgi:hypothetical protein